MKRKFNRNQKLMTPWDIQLSSLTSLGALFRDQSKTFDCLLTACTTWFTSCQIIRIWFCKTTKFILDYLVNHKQRTRILHWYGSWEQNFTRVPQGSMLGSFLFSIDLYDLFFILNTSEIANYVHNNMPYVTLWKPLNLLFWHWKIFQMQFMNSGSQMQFNASKCHVLIDTNQKEQVNVVTLWTENRKYVKFLGVNIDSKLNFDKHIKIICVKPRAK